MMFPNSNNFFLELNLQNPPLSDSGFSNFNCKYGTGYTQPPDPSSDSGTIFFRKKVWNGQPVLDKFQIEMENPF